MLDTNTKSAVSFQAVFFRFDKDQSGDMNLFELRDALKSLGSYVPVASFSQIVPLLEHFPSTAIYFCLVISCLAGYQLSNSALSAIILRYHNKKGTIPFDIFIQILVRVIVMFG